MPRNNAINRGKNGKSVKYFDASKHSARKQIIDIKKEKCIKKELVFNTPKETVVEEVVHRKSERRKVARDIFLVFEEESNFRRKTRANKKTKPKFGHLKVEDHIKPKGLLRDIKNEQKCCGSSASVKATSLSKGPTLNRNLNQFCVEKKEINAKFDKAQCKTVSTGCSNKLKNINSIKLSTLASQTCTLDDERKLIARVNPIFLWVKQDDTRIVEVRCEDYDKRNRIRITKTSNGWRAIPRSDPTTSRVIKFYPTPLLKVKKENNRDASNISNNHFENKDVVCNDLPNKLPDIVNKIETVYNPLTFNNLKSITSSKKSKKNGKKTHSGKTVKKFKSSSTVDCSTMANNTSFLARTNLDFNTNPSEERNFLLQTNAKFESKMIKGLTLHNDLHPNDLAENIPAVPLKQDADDMDINKNCIDLPFKSDAPLDTKYTYQTEKDAEKEISFHLCPKTGLFLSNNVSISEYESESNENIKTPSATNCVQNCVLASSKDFNIEKEKNALVSNIQLSEENSESLEAKTKNLKDLLDDADLLQNCDDNANSDADLIDTLVKTSCENNLIQANEIITKATMDQLHQETLHEANEMVVQLIADVSEPPKCLSFNEAGEIEGLNGELFQSNTYMESFDKHSSDILSEPHVILHSTTSVAEPSEPSQNIEPIDDITDVNSTKLLSVSEIEESVKDLSYKKREEVCPPSESRSQCAVTSSSDVIKSSQQEQAPSLASSSDTLKTLILEQFIKLNALTTQHRRESIDPENQRNSAISNIKPIYTSKLAESSGFIETVIIDDDENESDIEHEGPLKKRLRLNKPVVQNVGKLAMMDKDPDPLTQLRLLIRNTQWKVPDPILVPKDRLGAVLASPAREIPLLITTRPELRLPEAFAYPEIIQNPNILVISMAQLEAILKNELEVEKSTTFNTLEADVNQQLSGEQIEDQLLNDLQSPRQNHHTSTQPKNSLSINNSQVTNNITPMQTNTSDALSENRQQYGQFLQADPTFTSDVNSATMAVLNQMLWLPYLGQISQDIGKTVKEPIALKEKCPDSVPFFNSGLNGIKNLREILKTTTTNNKMSAQTVLNTWLQNFQHQFKTNEELSLFQKIVQHQMQSVLQLSQLKVDSSHHATPLVAADNTVSSINKSNCNIETLPKLIEERKQKVIYSNNKQANTSVCKNQINNCSNNISLPEKSYNLRSSVAARQSFESKQYSNNSQRQITDKPRLTCKSLSNLLDPEHNVGQSLTSSIPNVKNLPSNFLKRANEFQRSSEHSSKECNTEIKRQFLSNGQIVPPSPRTFGNISIESSSEPTKQKVNIFGASSSNNDAPGIRGDPNIALWHPLFGRSKNETLYNMFDEYYGRPIFRLIMSERSFLNIHKIIRFDNVLARRAQKSSDKFAPIRNLWDKWSKSLSQFYNPNDCVTVDEQLLGFHGRCKFRQYILSKPERYGLKFWVLVDSRSCYVWKMQPYLGKDVSGVPERNQGERYNGHNVTMDNFFSSHSLGQKLLQRNLTMVGTMRKNKRSIPPKLLVCKKVPRYESSFAFTPNTTLVSYISHKGKCTIAMSTMHHDQKVLNGPKKLPEIISFYNSTKGGVDTVDKMLSSYSCKRKNNRWTMTVFSNIIDVSALNAYIIYNEVDTNWKTTQKHTKRKCFLHELAISLAKPYMEKHKNLPRSEFSLMIYSKLSNQNFNESNDSEAGPSKKRNVEDSAKKKRARCQKCYTSGENKNKWTSYFCCLCKKPCCNEKHFKSICADCISSSP